MNQKILILVNNESSMATMSHSFILRSSFLIIESKQKASNNKLLLRLTFIRLLQILYFTWDCFEMYREEKNVVKIVNKNFVK